MCCTQGSAIQPTAVILMCHFTGAWGLGCSEVGRAEDTGSFLCHVVHCLYHDTVRCTKDTRHHARTGLSGCGPGLSHPVHTHSPVPGGTVHASFALLPMPVQDIHMLSFLITEAYSSLSCTETSLAECLSHRKERNMK